MEEVKKPAARNTVTPSSFTKRLELAEKRAIELNVTIKEIDPTRCKSKVIFVCNECGVEGKGTRLDFFLSVIKTPRCCADKAKLRPPGPELEELLEKRNHEMIGPRPKSSKETFWFNCLVHKTVNKSVFENYKKQDYGAICCAAPVIKAKRRARALFERKPNKAKFDRFLLAIWAEDVRKVFKQCPITGEGFSLETHHYYNKSHYPHLAYEVKNGILLNKKLHRAFHHKHTWQKPTTPEMLKDYFLELAEFAEKNPNSKIKKEAYLKGVEIVENAIKELESLTKELDSSTKD
jgi:hypothetical protein